MASMAISRSAPSNSTQTIPSPKAAPVQAETTDSPSADLKPDNVKLSAAAQAKMMHRAGQSPSLIAATLGTDIKSIDGYLNIKVAAPVVATPTPVAQAAPSESAEPATTAPAAAPVAQPLTGKQ